MQVTTIDITHNKDKISAFIAKTIHMPLSPTPDTAYIRILEQGREISVDQANTVLWQQALHDTLAIKSKSALKLVTG